jgi:hypothetical protein
VTGLAVGAALALGGTAWVLAPIFRAAERGGGPAAALGAGALKERGAEPACPACGARPELDARFCSNCGRSLDA